MATEEQTPPTPNSTTPPGSSTTRRRIRACVHTPTHIHGRTRRTPTHMARAHMGNTRTKRRRRPLRRTADHTRPLQHTADNYGSPRCTTYRSGAPPHAHCGKTPMHGIPKIQKFQNSGIPKNQKFRNFKNPLEAGRNSDFGSANPENDNGAIFQGFPGRLERRAPARWSGRLPVRYTCAGRPCMTCGVWKTTGSLTRSPMRHRGRGWRMPRIGNERFDPRLEGVFSGMASGTTLTTSPY